MLSKSKSKKYVTWIANLTKLFLSVYIHYIFPIKNFSPCRTFYTASSIERSGANGAARGLDGLRGFCTSVFRGRPLVAYCADALRYYFIRTDRANGVATNYLRYILLEKNIQKYSVLHFGTFNDPFGIHSKPRNIKNRMRSF